LTYFGVPSDHPPGGSGGRLVLIPVDVGIACLDTIVGMAVNTASTFSKHEPTQKIGVIEKAWTGDADASGAVPVYVSGYLYEADFPDLIADLRAEKDELGFSYEIKNATGFVNESNHLELSSLTFTGAAILYAKKAAYTKTSLAAEKEDAMNEDQIRELIAGMFGSKIDDVLNAWEEFKKQFEGDGKYASLSVYLNAAAENEAKIKTLESDLAAAKSEIESLKTELNAAKANINASAESNADETIKTLQAQVDEMKTKIDELTAEAIAREAHQRKSKPATLAGKYGIDAATDLNAANALIDSLELSPAEAIGLKMQAAKKFARNQ
jgi:signal transduction histidine kinase